MKTIEQIALEKYPIYHIETAEELNVISLQREAFKQGLLHLNNINFWQRLENFVKDIQVNDAMSDEEKEMILNICKQFKK